MLRTSISVLPIAFIALVFATASPGCALGGEPETNVKSEQTGALGGYDPVSYFTGAPVRGQTRFTASFRGGVYRFATAENRSLFLADGAAYAPQYGGYCAWAAARGYTAPRNPRFWKVVNGKLYLNFDAAVQKRWEKDIAGFIAEADANWPGILQK